MAVALVFDALQPGGARALQLLGSPQPSLNDTFPSQVNDLSVAFVGEPMIARHSWCWMTTM